MQNKEKRISLLSAKSKPSFNKRSLGKLDKKTKFYVFFLIAEAPKTIFVME